MLTQTIISIILGLSMPSLSRIFIGRLFPQRIPGHMPNDSPYKHKAIHYKYDEPEGKLALTLKMDNNHCLQLTPQILFPEHTHHKL